MVDLDRLIRRRFRVRGDDIPPYRGVKTPGSRLTLAALMAEAGFTSGAEIGVYRGDYSAALCRTIPGLRLLCIDPWVPYASGALTKTPAAEAEKNRTAALEALRPYDVLFAGAIGSRATIRRMTSQAAVLDVPERSLDFVYIDGDHEFDATMLDLIHWSRRVKPGGIVAGHDYGVAYRVGVMKAVDAYTAGHHISDWYVTRDTPPGYFWVNP